MQAEALLPIHYSERPTLQQIDILVNAIREHGHCEENSCSFTCASSRFPSARLSARRPSQKYFASLLSDAAGPLRNSAQTQARRSASEVALMSAGCYSYVFVQLAKQTLAITKRTVWWPVHSYLDTMSQPRLGFRLLVLLNEYVHKFEPRFTSNIARTGAVTISQCDKQSFKCGGLNVYTYT